MHNALRYIYLIFIFTFLLTDGGQSSAQQIRHRYITVCVGASGNYTYQGVDGTGDTLFYEDFENGIGSCWYTNKSNYCINNFEAKNRIYLWDYSDGVQSQAAYRGRSAFAESVNPYERCGWVNGYIAYLATPQVKIDIPSQTKLSLYYYNEAFTQDDWYYGYHVYYDEFGILYYAATSTPIANRNFSVSGSGSLNINGSGPIAYLYQESYTDTWRWTLFNRNLNNLQAGYNTLVFGHKDLSAVGVGIDNVLVKGPRLIPIPTEVSTGAPGFTFTTTETYDNTFGCVSEIAYYHWTVAGPTESEETVTTLPYTWRDGNTYTIPGDYEWHGTNAAGCDSTAYLHIRMTHEPDQPDNIEPVNCAAQPEGSLWTITNQWSSEGMMVSNLVTPLVGDLDGDNTPEIVCFGVAGQSTAAPNRVKELLVFDGVTHLLKASISLPAYATAFAAAPYGLIREGGRGLIVVAHDDGYLRAYDFTASTPLQWTSDQQFSVGNDKYTVVTFADLDNDGHAEAIVRNKVFDVATGHLLATATGGSNIGASYAHQGNTNAPLRQKISMACVANIDASDDVMEVILGNEIYKPVLTAGRISGLQLWRTAPSLPAGVNESDGHAQVADFNLDGHLDVFISNRYVANANYANNGTVTFYVWDVTNNTVSNATSIPTSVVGKSLPLIANIDTDPNLEIVIQCAARNNPPGTGISTYKYDYNNLAFNFVWNIGVNEDSYSNGVTCFDFDQDGEMELLICDQASMKIVDGEGRTKSTLAYAEVTIMQYPIIADVDNDGHAEIISVGNPDGRTTMNGSLNIFRSAGAQWPPARPVWNQYMYNVTNVNKDLTLPRYLFDNATPFTDPDDATVTHRPYNNFLQQATTIDEHGRPFNPVADIAIDSAKIIPNGNDAYTVSITYTNIGNLQITAPYTITFYQDTYHGARVGNMSASRDLPVGTSETVTYNLSRIDLCSRSLNGIVVAVNDAGSGIAQHGGQQGECDTINNLYSLIPDLHCSDTTYENITACDSLLWHGTMYRNSGLYYFDTVGSSGADSVAGLYLTINYATSAVSTVSVCDSYTWELNGTTYTTGGTFIDTIPNTHNCDSVATLNLTVVNTPTLHLSNDTTIISCATATLTATGADYYVWTPTTALDNNITIGATSSVTASPSRTTNYTVRGYALDNSPVPDDITQFLPQCYDEQSVTIEIIVDTTTITSCNSYTWHLDTDTIITTSGTYSSHTSTATGCDSLVTVIVDIQMGEAFSFDTTVCDNYLWAQNDSIYTATTHDEVHYRNRYDCDSTYAINLTILHSTTSQTNISVCDSYAWELNGATYTAGGTFTDTIPNYVGCDSVATLNLTVVTTPTLHLSNDTTIISCATAILTATGADYYVWTPSTALDNNITVGATSSVTASPSRTTNYTVRGYALGNSPVPDDITQFLPQCYDEQSVTIEIIVDTTTITSCNSYTWHLDTDTIITTSGIYTSHITTSTGCDSLVAVNANLQTGETFTFDTAACYSYRWPQNDSLYTSSTIDMVQYRNRYGCDSTYHLSITIDTATHAPVQTEAFCYYYEWQVQGHDSLLTVSGTYHDTTSNARGCDSILTLDLTILDCPIDTPDVVQDPQCFVQPPASAFDMQELYRVPGANSGTTPFVGDVDGDGVTEIVVCGNPIASRYGDDFIVIDGRDGTIKYRIETETYRFSGQLMTIIDADANGRAELYLLAEDHYLYCYDATGAGQLWRSTVTMDRRYITMAADINGDGRAEIICGPYIFDAQSGTLLLQGSLQASGMGYGSPNTNWTPSNTPITNRHTGSVVYPNAGEPYKYYMQALADMDRDGQLEICAGNSIYKPVINNAAGTAGNTWQLLRQADANANITGWDGQTFIADFDGDGDEDVCVLGFRTDNKTDLYVWNGQTSTIIGYYNVNMSGGYGTYGGVYNANRGLTPSIPFCGDLDGNGTPEIIFNHPDAMRAFTYDATQSNRISMMHYSTALGETGGFTVFDFNQDGRNEIIYRNETHIGVVDGVTLANLATPISCHSGTVSEYPIVADVNGDGHAEIITTGNDTLFDYQQWAYSGDLRVYGSVQAGAWSSARRVWNQFNYNSVNINEDLTVPQHQFNVATRFPNGTEPFNSFLRQTPSLNRNGDIYMTAPDVYIVEDSTHIDFNHSGLIATVRYCNQGETPFFAPHRITLYNDDYRGQTLVTNTSNQALEPGQCNTTRLFVSRSVLCHLESDSLMISVNDGGWGVAQHGGQQSECDTVNNLLRMPRQPFVPDSNVSSPIACDTYTWHTDHDTVISNSGHYRDTVTDRYGCDSIAILYLTIRHSSDTTLRLSPCDSFYWDATTTTYLTDTIDYAHLQNDAGCDSMMTLMLTLRHSTTAQLETAEECEHYTWSATGETLTATGLYSDTTTNREECDSVRSLDLYIAAPPTLNVSHDTTIFTCGMATLRATGGDIYYWSPTATLSDTVSTTTPSVVIARPDSTQTYTVTTYRLGRNRIFNGDFSLGDTGFFTALVPTNHSSQYGEYEIGYDAIDFTEFRDWRGRDHTTPYDRNGRFFIADGIEVADSTAWGQRVAVEPDATYLFTLWSTSIAANNHAELEIYINGNPIGGVVPMTDSISTYGVWTRHEIMWNSGSARMAEIRILNHNAHAVGNDFGLDDISLRKLLCTDTRTITVTVGVDTATATACNSYTWAAAANRVIDSSGIYTDTIVTRDGCDSTIALNLTMHYSDTTHIAADTCDRYTWTLAHPARTHTTTTTDTAMLRTAYGCDSIVTLHLTIRASSPIDLLDTTPCDQFTWEYDNTTYRRDTTVTYHTVNSVGCDSTNMLRLTLHHRSTQTEIYRGCDSYVWPVDGQTYTHSSKHTDTLADQYGCDSIVTLLLNIYYSDSTALTDTTCDNQPYTFGSQRITTTGIYIQQLTNKDQCDSIVTLDLTVLPTYDIVLYDTVKEQDLPYTAPDGNTFRFPAVDEKMMFHTVVGKCDSLIHLNLEVLYIMDNCDELLIFPNLVTPNGDGINDIFSVIGVENLCWPHNELRIYNRWGALMHKAVNLRHDDEGWDPANVPAGTYYYHFQGSNPHHTIERHGVIEVVK